MAVCTQCGRGESETEFYTATRSFGLAVIQPCKPCFRKRNQQNRQARQIDKAAPIELSSTAYWLTQPMTLADASKENR